MQLDSIIDFVLATGKFRTQKKSIYFAAILGFLFGALGLGIYLRSWYVFFMTFATLVICGCFIDVHLLVWCAIAGAWGGLALWRAQLREPHALQSRRPASPVDNVLDELPDTSRVGQPKFLPQSAVGRISPRHATN